MTDEGVDVSRLFNQELWDERYSGGTLFSGDPNPWLVRHAQALIPGAALDVGSGEGADALWLAGRGWHVTGVDISPVALAYAARLARQAGEQVAARTTWQQADVLEAEFPESTFDLVSAHYVHLPSQALTTVHRRLAAAVRPGGSLLLVLHEAPEPGTGQPGVPLDFFPTAEDVASVLDPDAWTIDVGRRARAVTDSPHPAGHTHDIVLYAVRRPGRPDPRLFTTDSTRMRARYWSMAEARWVSQV